MALNGPIVFNSGTGSDAAASGLGPATATTGAATTDGTDTVLVGDTTGISAGDLLFCNTPSGTAFAEITSFVANTSITCASRTFAAGATTYAVGGKRATFDNPFSRQLFADIEAAWDIRTETDQDITSALVIASGMARDMRNTVFLRGVGAMPKIRNTVSGAVISMETVGLVMSNLRITHSGTPGTGVLITGGFGKEQLTCARCIIGDPVEQLSVGIDYSGSNDATRFVTVSSCTIQDCTSDGMQLGGPFSGSVVNVLNSALVRNGGWGMNNGAGQSPCLLDNCLIADNTGTGGVRFPAATNCLNRISRSTIVNNAVGVRVTQSNVQGIVVFITDNIIAFNTTGLELNNYADGNMSDFHNNIFWNNSSADVTGSIVQDPIGLDPIQADPLFINSPDDPGTNDYRLQPTSPAINAGVSQTDAETFPTIGAVQPEVTSGGGGGGMLIHPGMAGGIRG